jgi:hypothetical protein
MQRADMPTTAEPSRVTRTASNKWSIITLLVSVGIGILLGAVGALPFGRFGLGIGLGAVGGIAVSAGLNRKGHRTPGAFAVGQLVLGAGPPKMEAVLPISYLADGAIIYTALMTVDICQMMREKFVGSAAFTVAGKALLLLISVLPMGGWFLVSLAASRAGG